MAKKKQPTSPKPKPAPKAPKTGDKDNVQNTNTYVGIAVVLTVAVVYIALHIHKPQASSPAINTANTKQIVARTEPEIGEALTTSIIKTEADGAIATSITVYEPTPAAPDVVDITAELSTQTPAPTVEIRKELQEANIARATLELAKQLNPTTENNTKALTILALYSALNTGAPEAVALARKAGAGKLQASLAKFGPLTLADVLAHAGTKTAAVPIQTIDGEDVPLPSWWAQTFGQFIHVTKTEERAYVAPTKPIEVTGHATGNAVRRLSTLLKQGEWQAAEHVLTDLPDGAYKTLAAAYITQRQAMAHLLGITLGVQ